LTPTHSLLSKEKGALPWGSRDTLARLAKHQSAVISQQNLVELVAALTKKGVSPGDATMYAENLQKPMPVMRPTGFLKGMKGKPLRGAKVFGFYLAATSL